MLPIDSEYGGKISLENSHRRTPIHTHIQTNTNTSTNTHTHTSYLHIHLKLHWVGRRTFFSTVSRTAEIQSFTEISVEIVSRKTIRKKMYFTASSYRRICFILSSVPCRYCTIFYSIRIIPLHLVVGLSSCLFPLTSTKKPSQSRAGVHPKMLNLYSPMRIISAHQLVYLFRLIVGYSIFTFSYAIRLPIFAVFFTLFLLFPSFSCHLDRQRVAHSSTQRSKGKRLLFR